jgi:hypothetical protein
VREAGVSDRSEQEGEDDAAYKAESRAEWVRLARISGYLMGAGFQMAVIVAGFTFLGAWLDGKLGWSGILTATGAVVGFLLSLYAVMRTLRRLGGGSS